MIPDGWQEQSLDELIDSLEAGVSVNGEDRRKNEDELGVLKVSAVTYGRFDPTAHKAIVRDEEGLARVNPRWDSIIISRANTLEMVGASAYIDRDYFDLFLSDKLWQIRKAHNDFSVRWLSYVLAFEDVRNLISSRATGTSGSMKNISKEAFLSIKIPVPPLYEQRAIAAILSTWDEAITLTEYLIAALRQRKQGIMQLLLTGDVRFLEFGKSACETGEVPEGWQVMRLGDVFERVNRTTEEVIENVLSITATVGFVDQREKFGKVIAGKNLARYTHLLWGEFAYNKGNSDAYPQGCIYMLDEFEEGLVPNVYFCFRALPQYARNDFYKFYFENGSLNQQLQRLINSGVRNDGLLNLAAEKFFSAKVMVPPLGEQERIASALEWATAQVDLLIKQAYALREQKKGLMQQLLTGQIRVSMDE